MNRPRPGSVLYCSSTGRPGAPDAIGAHICNFANAGVQTCVTAGGDNPVITIRAANQGSQFLFLEARDWNLPTNHNNDFLLRAATITTVVPEPASLMLLGSGILGMAGLRRRFKK